MTKIANDIQTSLFGWRVTDKEKSTLTFTTAVSVIRLFPALLKFLTNKLPKTFFLASLNWGLYLSHKYLIELEKNLAYLAKSSVKEKKV